MQRIPLDSYAYSLARIRWDVFGTLTFRSVPTAKRAYGRAWALMRLGAKLVQRPYSQLLIALRAELGEMTGRFHFHFLLGGTQTRNAITLSHQLEHRWYGLFGQGRWPGVGHTTAPALGWPTLRSASVRGPGARMITS
jgi:hypothetical protein